MDDDFIIPVFVVFAELSDTFLGTSKYCLKMDAAGLIRHFHPTPADKVELDVHGFFAP